MLHWPSWITAVALVGATSLSLVVAQRWFHRSYRSAIPPTVAEELERPDPRDRAAVRRAEVAAKNAQLRQEMFPLTGGLPTCGRVDRFAWQDPGVDARANDAPRTETHRANPHTGGRRGRGDRSPLEGTIPADLIHRRPQRRSSEQNSMCSFRKRHPVSLSHSAAQSKGAESTNLPMTQTHWGSYLATGSGQS